jgi:predicted secreted protein
MAKINGTDLTIYIPSDTNDNSATTWIPIALAKSSTLSISLDTPDASNKDSSGWAEVIGGQKGWSMDFDGLVDFTLTDASGGNFDGLFTYFVNRTKIKCAFGQDSNYWYGDCFIASLDMSAEMESPVSYSGSLTGTGALTQGSNSNIDSSAAYPS